MRSTLVLFVPQAEPIVGAWRRAHDPAAAADLGAHVTLLFPFVPPPQIDDGVLDRLQEQFANGPGISGELELHFDRVARFPDLCYLALANVDEVRRKIIALSAAWPEYPPYEGRFPDPVPHLTIAHGDETLFASIEAEVSGALPLVARARHVSLAVEDDSDRWREHARFPLA